MESQLSKAEKNPLFSEKIDNLQIYKWGIAERNAKDNKQALHKRKQKEHKRIQKEFCRNKASMLPEYLQAHMNSYQ